MHVGRVHIETCEMAANSAKWSLTNLRLLLRLLSNNSLLFEANN